jgi:hypothetical protein
MTCTSEMRMTTRTVVWTVSDKVKTEKELEEKYVILRKGKK